MPPSESDVRFPDWYGRAGMSAFFCSDAFEYPFDSVRLQGGISVRAEIIVDEQKPVRRCLALAQRERFSKVLKHQVNRFRTICTVCGFVALS